MNICPRCKGTGFISSPVRNGICFKCEGSGDHIEYKKHLAVKQQKQVIKDIEDLKVSIAVLYKAIQKSKLVKVNEGRRKQAKVYYDKLKEYGIELTLDEIKDIANKLN